jgi:co-chaperonin GroES (HSP10)
MSKTNGIIPSDGILVIEELDTEALKQITTSSSLEIAGENAHSQLSIGRVLQVGETKITDYGSEIEPPATEGNLVCFPSLSADKLRIAGKQYLLVEFRDIKAVINKGE